ncbi:MAG: ArnT family glycosyltransferase [Phycisphaerae bacterium]
MTMLTYPQLERRGRAPQRAAARDPLPRPAAPAGAWPVVSMLVVALSVRLIFSLGLFQVVVKESGIARGSDKYEFIGKSLAAGYGYRFAPDLSPSMFLPPAYPLFLGGLFSLTPPEQHLVATQVAQSVLDTLSCLLIYLLAAPHFGRRAALIGAWCYALYPGAWVSCSRYLTEPLFVLLTLLFVYALGRYLVRAGWLSLLAAGAACAAMVLCKSVAGMLPVFVIGCALVLPIWAGRRWPVVRAAVACLLVTAIGVAPWVYRNYRVSGTYVYPTSAGGLALYTAYTYAAHPEQTIRKSVDQAAAEVRALGEANGVRLDPRDAYPRWFYSAQDEIRLDRLAQAEARRRISADTASFARHVLGNVWRFWFGAPTPKSVLASIALNGTLLVLGAVGIVLSAFWRRPAIAAWVVVSLYLFLGHVAVLAVVRYSLTVMPMICLFAGVAIAWLLERVLRARGIALTRVH